MTSSAATRPAHLAMHAAVKGLHTFCQAAKLRGLIADALTDLYRPGSHYMRGAGPKWCERHIAARPGPSYPG